MENPIPTNETEATYAGELAAAQAKTQAGHEIANLAKEGKAFGKPSIFKYIVLFFLATIVDIVDFAELSGVGYFIAKTIAIFCSILMFLIFWFTGTKQKQASEFTKGLEQMVAKLQANIDHVARLTVKYSRLARHIPGGRKAAIKIYKIAKSNPMTGFLAASIINLMPIIDLLPWSIIGVYLSYRDEKSAYRIAAEEAETAANDLQAQLDLAT